LGEIPWQIAAIRKWTDAGQGMQMKADSVFTGKINEDVRDPKSWVFH